MSLIQGHNIFEMFLQQTSRDIKLAVGGKGLKYRRKVWADDSMSH